MAKTLEAAAVTSVTLAAKMAALPREAQLDPNYRGSWIHLPVLNSLGDDQDACASWIRVQSLGPAPVKAVLLAWGEAGFCHPQAAGPITVRCSGLIKPGGAWFMHGWQIPDGTQSGMLFQLSGRRLSDFGLDAVYGFDAVFADYLCWYMQFDAMCGYGFYRQFLSAYADGGDYLGMPMDLASGRNERGQLAVEVHRECAPRGSSGSALTSAYRGVSSSEAATYDNDLGAYVQQATLPFAAQDGFDSWVYVHSAGQYCASLDVWMHPSDGCGAPVLCDLGLREGVAGGETIRFKAQDCVGDAWRGSVTIRSSQPIVVAVDVVGNNSLMTYGGTRAPSSDDLDAEILRPQHGSGYGLAAPLVALESDGCETAVHVRNTSSLSAAKVRALLVSPTGKVDRVLTDWICPGGTWSFRLSAIHGLSPHWSGSVRIDGMPWSNGSDVAPDAPWISGFVSIGRREETDPTATPGAAAYELMPVQTFGARPDMPSPPGYPEPSIGDRVIAFPTTGGDMSSQERDTRVAVTNLRPTPGFTDFAVFVFDENGPVDMVCYRLGARETAYIDVATLGAHGASFRGSLIVSAWFWEHDEWSRDGRWFGNSVGLGAVALHEWRSTAIDGVRGDGVSASAGIPVAALDASGRTDFRWLVPAGGAPVCPSYRPVVPPNGGPRPLVVDSSR